MSYEVVATPRFRRDIKKLSRKYPSLKSEFSDMVNLLENHPEQGSSLGSNCYKIRLAIASKGK
jgi:mRNA-degrading endonuclease RelE of RelBE toxin-antitoxin system